jgi:hypothetical protein
MPDSTLPHLEPSLLITHKHFEDPRFDDTPQLLIQKGQVVIGDRQRDGPRFAGFE